MFPLTVLYYTKYSNKIYYINNKFEYMISDALKIPGILQYILKVLNSFW